MANIQAVARLAGTSRSTVSRVISGNPHVSPAAKAKVLAAIKQLGYVPNSLARQMRAQKSHTIGLLTAGYFPTLGDFLNEFAQSAQQYGYHVNVYVTRNAEEERAVLANLETHLLDAVYLMTQFNDWPVIEQYAQFGPIATWRRLDSPVIYSSYVDHYPVYLQILAYLAAKHLTRIGHVLSAPSSTNTKARLRAIHTFAQAHPSIDQSWQVFSPVQAGAGIKAAQQWLVDDQRPPAVIIYSDYVAADFIATLRQAGKTVPRDCQVFGFDNSAFGRVMGLTTIDPKLGQQAQNAFAYLYNQLHKQQLPITPITPVIVRRESC